MREDWSSYVRDKEVDILKEYATRAKLFTLGYACELFVSMNLLLHCYNSSSLWTVFVYSVLLMYFVTPIIPVLLDVLVPLNESRPRRVLFLLEYFADKNWYYLGQVEACFGAIICLTIFIVADSIYVMYVEHACSLFAVVRYKISRFGFVQCFA